MYNAGRKEVYPIILHPGEKGDFYVEIPDLDIGTQGNTIAECIDMARDAIGLWGIAMQDEHREIPVASETLPKAETGAIVTLVDVDFDEYRCTHELRTVRKNVSLPAWLCALAEKANVNFSAVLQEGLKSYLHVSEPHI